MAIDPRHKLQPGFGIRRDVRPWTIRFVAWLRLQDSYLMIMGVLALFLLTPISVADFSNLWAATDIIALIAFFYSRWYLKQLPELPFKLPAFSGLKDKNNPAPGKSGPGKSDGILFLGNVRDGVNKGDELWLTNSDARTHMLFLGTTGAGKTEGLKSLVSNAMCWGSGFVYVDGKAQNTLWGDIYSLARRFGRDDDVLVLNYMTGNSDAGSQSNSLNPFSIGSASYLTQMMVGLMDDSGDDNAMWKGRAISLMSALMPALTWKRDNQGLLMDVGVIRDHLGMPQIIKMSRDPGLPDRIIRGLQSYLDTLPGYVDSAFDNDGNERPQSNDQPMVDLSQTRQQHGYLTMQFTRSLSSLADEYGYIFKQQLADIDMMDVVLNRRILVVLIPALEKSPDEAANLGKIVVAALKGMMGATLGADLEGEQSSIIDNNPTRSDSPFMTVFDEVGYYTSPGMGVMAAQARSLGFSLIFAGQDMPALQKRVKEEALSITGNCNLKIFGKLEDPTETKDFFEKTVASAMVSEVSGFSASQGVTGRTYSEGDNITFQAKKEASYDDLRRQREGQVHFLWADKVVTANMFNAAPPRADSVRVQRFLAVSPRNWSVEARDKAITEVLSHMRDQSGRAANQPLPQPVQEITWMAGGYNNALNARQSGAICAAIAVANITVGMKQRATEVVPPTLGTPASGQGYWPFGAATAAGSPQVPAMPGQSPQQAAPVPSANTPPWMMGAAPQQPSQPPQAPQFQQQPAATGTAPPWMQQAPQSPQQQPFAQSAPPPWAGGAAGQPQTPSQTPPMPPQPFGWGNVMGGATGMGTPPSGAQVVQAPTTPPPPPWMVTPPGGRPPAAPPPWAGGASAQPQKSPPPPWAAGAVPPAQPQPVQGVPPQAASVPPWMGGAPLPAQPVQPMQAQPPMQAPVPPPFVAPPVAPAPIAPAPVVHPTTWPSAMPEPPPEKADESAPDIEAILRNAADNLSGEMFPDMNLPEDDESK